VDQSLDGRLVQVTQIGGGLSGLLTHDNRLGLDKTECIDDNLAFDGLDWVDDYSNSARRKLLEGLLSVDINGGEPASEPGMGVIPTDNGFRSKSCVLSTTLSNLMVIAYRPVCLSMSIILVWNTGSTASTLTPVPL
jgi:hypothetical protein